MEVHIYGRRGVFIGGAIFLAVMSALLFWLSFNAQATENNLELILFAMGGGLCLLGMAWCIKIIFSVPKPLVTLKKNELYAKSSRIKTIPWEVIEAISIAEIKGMPIASFELKEAFLAKHSQTQGISAKMDQKFGLDACYLHLTPLELAPEYVLTVLTEMVDAKDESARDAILQQVNTAIEALKSKKQ